jgi:hypothetical protein
MPRKSPRKRSPRKGKVVKMNQIESPTRAKVRELSQQHGDATQLRSYKNGTLGAFFEDGQFRFVRGANNIKGISRSPRKKNYSKRAAKSVFSRYYNKRTYKSPKGKKAAMKRDHCTENKNVVSDSRWARNPGKYDLKGFDDGSNCEGTVRKSRRPPASQIDKALTKRGLTRKSQRGGNVAKPVSLKTAVGLLRQYYAEKYN